ncbi:MAG: hypothetical protein JXO22_12725 [Phycisphaerae bacterium]|nr:hypothetical protein [Phycisphaerae bacterium]
MIAAIVWLAVVATIVARAGWAIVERVTNMSATDADMLAVYPEELWIAAATMLLFVAYISADMTWFSAVILWRAVAGAMEPKVLAFRTSADGVLLYTDDGLTPCYRWDDLVSVQGVWQLTFVSTDRTRRSFDVLPGNLKEWRQLVRAVAAVHPGVRALLNRTRPAWHSCCWRLVLYGLAVVAICCAFVGMGRLQGRSVPLSLAIFVSLVPALAGGAAYVLLYRPAWWQRLDRRLWGKRRRRWRAAARAKLV